ncbi:MAG: mechanosensitive ion channel domain-containing protein, partial [Bacteroidota bacterium]
MNKSDKVIKSSGFLLIFAILMISVLTIDTYGQEENDKNQGSEAIRNVSPVMVDGTVLFYIKGIKSFPSEERAAIIARRIVTVASNRSFPVDSLKVLAKDDQLKIYAGKEFIMFISREDAREEGVDRTILARWILKRIQEGITSYRYLRSGPVWVKSIIHALAAVILLAVSLFMLMWLIGRLNKWLKSRINAKVTSMENKSFHIIQSSHLWKAIGILFRTLKIFVIVAVSAVFLQYILSLFPSTMGFTAYTLALFVNPVISIWKGFLNFIPGLAFLVIIYLVTRYLLKLIKLFFTSIHEGGIVLLTFEKEWALPTYKILRIVIIAFALVIAYPYIPGSETSAFKGISVFLGVLLSLGSSSFISNIIAGYSMTYRAAFKNGDLIQVEDQIGYVEEQRLLVTRLRSRKNEEISIPNSELLNSNII